MRIRSKGSELSALASSFGRKTFGVKLFDQQSKAIPIRFRWITSQDLNFLAAADTPQTTQRFSAGFANTTALILTPKAFTRSIFSCRCKPNPSFNWLQKIRLRLRVDDPRGGSIAMERCPQWRFALIRNQPYGDVVRSDGVFQLCRIGLPLPEGAERSAKIVVAKS